jgi:hypothetical protein
VVVAGIKVLVATVWEMCSCVLDVDAVVVSACRVSSAMKSEDRVMAELAKNIAEGCDKYVHGRRR